MIKDKLAEAIETSLENIKNGEDRIPLGIRGELEVIVKDRDGNVLSYERDHNQVTKLAKMAIIHLLAGEIGTVDSNLYCENGSARAYNSSSVASSAKIASSFVPDNHTNNDESGKNNTDGLLVSGKSFFYDGTTVKNLSQVTLKDISSSALCANYPTKMLFGTGMEAADIETAKGLYASEIGGTDASSFSSSAISEDIVATLNGYDDYDSASGMFSNIGVGENWYVNELSDASSAVKCRTLQPATTNPLPSNEVSADTTAIKGAIKNGLIHNGNDSVSPNNKGIGYPCFIYATRSTVGFYNEGKEGSGGIENEVYYQKNAAIQNTNYETEIVYTVVMPAQPSGTTLDSYYPYNGWILKQAGLFSDSRYLLRSVPSIGTQSVYDNSVGGQLLFVRNLSSPILKTQDNEVIFNWHIFITV